MNGQQTMTIILTPDGNITVNGPIQNKVLAYGMLEAARDAILQFNEKEMARRVIPATVMPPTLKKNGQE